MGLAEPRKRLKISHDPRNLSGWQTTASSSFGARMMLQQGWKAGQGLGSGSTYESKNGDSSRVKVVYKDDSLGLGAKKKGNDVEAQRTGLDAFQGLLGRLNAKSEAEVEEVEREVERKKAEVFVRGRWGGIVWVRGGLLVNESKTEESRKGPEQGEDVVGVEGAQEAEREGEEDEGKERHSIEKRRRKEERRLRQEEKRLKKAAKAAAKESSEGVPKLLVKRTKEFRSPEEIVSSAEEDVRTPVAPSESARPPPAVRGKPIRTGRQILRGRHIDAKKAAFGDTKMLDEIFMRKT